jgi:general secretion pathway protein G
VNSRRSGGFTLIELLVTLAVLAVLATIAVPVAQVSHQRVREAELRRALHEIRDGIDAYHRASMEGRIPKSATSSDWPKDLDVLVKGVVDQQNPQKTKMYFLRRVPRDPMNADASLSDEKTWRKRAYVSEPDEPQEGDDVYDVYCSSDGIGLNGVAYAKW